MPQTNLSTRKQVGMGIIKLQYKMSWTFASITYSNEMNGLCHVLGGINIALR